MGPNSAAGLTWLSTRPDRFLADASRGHRTEWTESSTLLLPKNCTWRTPLETRDLVRDNKISSAAKRFLHADAFCGFYEKSDAHQTI